MNKRLRIYVAISLSFILAMVFTAMPLPSCFSWLHPHWITLVLMYWIIFSSNLIGVVAGFTAGVFLDLLGGSVLGSTGLVLAVVAFLTAILRPKLRQASFWQQLVVVISLVGFEQLISLWLQSFLGRSFAGVGYWWTTALSIVAWPILFSMLRSYQRKYRLL